MKLLCENNCFEFTRDMLAELEDINRFTKQALYFARSEHTEKDYSIREIWLSDVVHAAIADFSVYWISYIDVTGWYDCRCSDTIVDLLFYKHMDTF